MKLLKISVAVQAVPLFGKEGLRGDLRGSKGDPRTLVPKQSWRFTFG